MSNLTVNVSSRTQCYQGQSQQYWEGVVTIVGLKPTKLTKKNGETTFATLAAVIQSAKALAKRTGLELTIQSNSKATLRKTNTPVVTV